MSRLNLLFVILDKSGSFLEKANVMILTKEATDRQITKNPMLSTNNQKGD